MNIIRHIEMSMFPQVLLELFRQQYPLTMGPTCVCIRVENSLWGCCVPWTEFGYVSPPPERKTTYQFILVYISIC